MGRRSWIQDYSALGHGPSRLDQGAVTARSRLGPGLVTARSRLGPGLVTARSRLGPAAWSLLGHCSVTARSRLGHGSVTARSRFSHGWAKVYQNKIVRNFTESVDTFIGVDQWRIYPLAKSAMPPWYFVLFFTIGKNRKNIAWRSPLCEHYWPAKIWPSPGSP